MRVTGGTYGGRRLVCPPFDIRPAMDRMRESLFSILGNLAGLSFLDLFCGSGSMGVEAASRGADPVHLVEKDRRKKSYIEENLKMVDESTRLFLAPVERFLLRPPARYDLVYADPPFAYGHKADLLARIVATAAADRVLIHFPAPEDLPDRIEAGGARMQVYDDRRYGGSRVRFYRVDDAEA